MILWSPKMKFPDFNEEKMFKPRKDRIRVFAGRKKTQVFWLVLSFKELISRVKPSESKSRRYSPCASRCWQTTLEVEKLLNLVLKRIYEILFSAIEETGDIPYEILKPILSKCSPQQLVHIERVNPVGFGDFMKSLSFEISHNPFSVSGRRFWWALENIRGEELQRPHQSPRRDLEGGILSMQERRGRGFFFFFEISIHEISFEKYMNSYFQEDRFNRLTKKISKNIVKSKESDAAPKMVRIYEILLFKEETYEIFLWKGYTKSPGYDSWR